MSEQATESTFWGLVEVMGHKRYAGKVSEQVVAGTAFVRVDVPQTPDESAFTKLIGGGSIYGITPTTEAMALKMAHALKARPLEIYMGTGRGYAPALPFLDDSYEPADQDEDGGPF